MHVVMKEVGVFAHTLIIFMPGLNARGLQSKLLIIKPLKPGSKYVAQLRATLRAARRVRVHNVCLERQ